MSKFTKEIEVLENEAHHIGRCSMSAPAGGSEMRTRENALIAHAAVLRAAEGDKLAQKCAGYNWQEPGRVESALKAAADILVQS